VQAALVPHGAPFAKLLLEHQASLTEKNSEGRYPIHLAALHGHIITLKLLLCQVGTKVDIPELAKTRNTALHLAADANQGEACTVLIKGGADLDAQNDKGDTPLSMALVQRNGTPKSVVALVEGGASVYVANKAGLMPWEVAQKKEMCYSATTRNAFMKACDVIDPREFAIAEKLPQKQRVLGKGLACDWTTSTQFHLRSKKGIDEVTVLAYSIERTEECMKQIGFCVVKDKEEVHNLPSFQPEGIGFGALDPFKFPMEKDFSYTVVVYSNSEDLKGDFGVSIFTPQGSPQPTIKEAKAWRHVAKVSGEWKGKSAVGSSVLKGNPHYVLTCESKKATDLIIMLQQKTGDVSAIVFDDNRIVPAKFYIGMYVLEGTKEAQKSEKWHNSKDVYIRVTMGGDHPSEYVIVPTTRMPDEELEFELSAWSDGKVAWKKK